MHCSWAWGAARPVVRCYLVCAFNDLSVPSVPELQSPDFDAIADGEGPVRAPPGAGGNTLPLRIMACVFQWQEPHRGQRASVGGGDRVQSTGHVKLSDKILPVIRRNVITRETSTPGDSARGCVSSRAG